MPSRQSSAPPKLQGQALGSPLVLPCTTCMPYPRACCSQVRTIVDLCRRWRALFLIHPSGTHDSCNVVARAQCTHHAAPLECGRRDASVAWVGSMLVQDLASQMMTECSAAVLLAAATWPPMRMTLASCRFRMMIVVSPAVARLRRPALHSMDALRSRQCRYHSIAGNGIDCSTRMSAAGKRCMFAHLVASIPFHIVFHLLT